ncbi:cysteine desulfurase [Babesia caballi]|uniref:Cysteine desulfurase n=1 Tax=Babesia caballi TaxID=5871 RepID=A0AAV4LM94_BABCB|nr:cysteine desulfurase [Babesia caballi]
MVEVCKSHGRLRLVKHVRARNATPPLAPAKTAHRVVALRYRERTVRLPEDVEVGGPQAAPNAHYRLPVAPQDPQHLRRVARVAVGKQRHLQRNVVHLLDVPLDVFDAARQHHVPLLVDVGRPLRVGQADHRVPARLQTQVCPHDARLPLVVLAEVHEAHTRLVEGLDAARHLLRVQPLVRRHPQQDRVLQTRTHHVADAPLHDPLLRRLGYGGPRLGAPVVLLELLEPAVDALPAHLHVDGRRGLQIHVLALPPPLRLGSLHAEDRGRVEVRHQQVELLQVNRLVRVREGHHARGDPLHVEILELALHQPVDAQDLALLVVVVVEVPLQQHLQLSLGEHLHDLLARVAEEKEQQLTVGPVRLVDEHHEPHQPVPAAEGALQPDGAREGAEAVGEVAEHFVREHPHVGVDQLGRQPEERERLVARELRDRHGEGERQQLRQAPPLVLVVEPHVLLAVLRRVREYVQNHQVLAARVDQPAHGGLPEAPVVLQRHVSRVVAQDRGLVKHVVLRLHIRRQRLFHVVALDDGNFLQRRAPLRQHAHVVDEAQQSDRRQHPQQAPRAVQPSPQHLVQLLQVVHQRDLVGVHVAVYRARLGVAAERRGAGAGQLRRDVHRQPLFVVPVEQALELHVAPDVRQLHHRLEPREGEAHQQRRDREEHRPPARQPVRQHVQQRHQRRQPQLAVQKRPQLGQHRVALRHKGPIHELYVRLRLAHVGAHLAELLQVLAQFQVAVSVAAHNQPAVAREHIPHFQLEDVARHQHVRRQPLPLSVAVHWDQHRVGRVEVKPLLLELRVYRRADIGAERIQNVPHSLRHSRVPYSVRHHFDEDVEPEPGEEEHEVNDTRDSILLRFGGDKRQSPEKLDCAETQVLSDERLDRQPNVGPLFMLLKRFLNVTLYSLTQTEEAG